MVIVTQKFSLVRKLDFLVFFSTFWGVLHLSISQQPVELQKTTAPIFGVADGVLFDGHNKIDLRSPLADQKAVFHISATAWATKTADPIFGVAAVVWLNGHNKVDLGSSYASQQAVFCTSQPAELQKTAASIFVVAESAQFNGQNKVDLKSP